MLITAAPLIDIAPIERATMEDRVVVQYDKRDVETMKLIKLDLLGLGMLAAIDECVQLIEHDCAVCLDLDRIPEEIPEVFEMLQAADTVGVFQVESRAQMQTLPKSRPASLDDLVVEVAIIRPGPIQGNAVHPYLRRKQGLEPVTYLHPSLEPILHDTLGVILYQEQVMKIAIDVAGFTPAGSDGFRRAMGTWRSTREMEKLHAQFVDGCVASGHAAPRTPRSCSGGARRSRRSGSRRATRRRSPGRPTSRASSSCSTRRSSSVGLINAQPMGFYPVEVLVNDAKRHGVAVLPVDVNATRSGRRPSGWGGRAGRWRAGRRRRVARRRRRASRCRRAAASSVGPRRSGRRPCVIPARRRATGGRPSRDRLGRPAGAPPRQGDRRGARRRGWTRSWRGARTRRSRTSSSGPGSPRR